MRRAKTAATPSRRTRKRSRACPSRAVLTDGETLFRIERTLVEDARGDLLVELEDCGTLDLIVCSARLVGELGLRPVQPLGGG